jgi:hypothetical protein
MKMPAGTRPLLAIRFLTWLVGAVALLHSSAMAAPPQECAEAYEKAQEERKASHLTAAVEELRKCAAEICPSFIRKDCIQWMSETESAQPTVVFSVRRDGADLSSVEVLCDGRVVAHSIDGKAVALDPGAHVFTFRQPGAPSVEKRTIIREGERNRILEAELPAPIPEDLATKSSLTAAETPEETDESVSTGTDASVAPPATGRKWIPYALAGMGVLGVSGFTVFGLWGNSDKQDLERSCSPFCRPSQVDQVSTKYIVADTCLAVGLVSLGLATYWFLSDPRTTQKTSDSHAAVVVSPTASGRGGVLDLRTTF